MQRVHRNSRPSGFAQGTAARTIPPSSKNVIVAKAAVKRIIPGFPF
jgi:hypothetical protein